MTLNEDGTFVSPEASSFFSELSGHWEIIG